VRSAPDLSLALPCYNEQQCIRSTATHLIDAFRQKHIDIQLVLVDNGSTDDTGAIIDGLIAEGLPVVKRHVVRNQGYGYGVQTGLDACAGRFVGFICADEQVAAADVVRVYEAAARSERPSLAKVRRRFRQDGMKRKVVSVFYNLAANIVFCWLRTIDVNGNPKIFPRAYLEPMQLQSGDWFLDTEVMLKAKRLGLAVVEMNVKAQMRHAGVSHVRPSAIWEFFVNLWRWRMGHLPVVVPVHNTVRRP
jgi:glycosyltransferase involved in cell wall biosynthesis